MARKRRKAAKSIRIEGWDLDEANIEELDAHAISVEILEQVAEEKPRFRRNKKGLTASHQRSRPRGADLGSVYVGDAALYLETRNRMASR